MYKITIFTPTYNRAYRLGKLYNSLLNQTYQNFEWIIVDDGSTDNTNETINKFINENKIKIIYLYQFNKGKHIAINEGLKIATGILFFIVDSDDYLVENSLEFIINKYKIIEYNDEIAGLSGTRGIFDNQNKLITQNFNYNELICSALEFRYKYKIKGDMAEIFKTNILKQYPFPYFKNENFCTESLVWNRIAKKYKFLWINKIIYMGQYLDDGLTFKYDKLMFNNPQGSLTYYLELSLSNIPYRYKILALYSYIEIAKSLGIVDFSKKIKNNLSINMLLALLGFLPRKIRKKLRNR